MKKIIFILLIVLSLPLLSCKKNDDIVINKVIINTNDYDVNELKNNAIKKACKSTCYIRNDVRDTTLSGTLIKKVNDNYYIVTSSDIGKYKDVVTVVFSDNRVVGDICGMDEKNGLALVKVKNISFDVKVADVATKIKKGQMVISSTSKNDTSPNVINCGVVSRFDSYLILSDAIYNPYSFGGGLYDLDGNLLGINIEKKYSDIKAQEYIRKFSFALKSNIVSTSVNQMIEHGKIERKLLGIVALQYNYDMVAQTEYSDVKVPDLDKSYVFIVSVENLSNAYGLLKQKDIITYVNNVEISHLHDITSILRLSLPNENVEVKVKRYNSNIKLFEELTYNIILK